jgi:hypothetical protein
MNCGNGVTVEDYPDGTETTICVLYGDTPNVITGNCDYSILQGCGCCTDVCELWQAKIDSSETKSGDYTYIDCYTQESVTEPIGPGTTANFCILSGTLPTVSNNQLISLKFISCGCGA